MTLPFMTKKWFVRPMSSVIDTQRAYTLYAGDFQFRTYQDQGPMQNPAIDKGAIPVAIRHPFNDAIAPSFVSSLIAKTYDDFVEPHLDGGAQFTGIVGMGDYLDLACEQEVSLLMISLEQMLAYNPNLGFSLMANGNHDGAYYMGTVASTRNFAGLIGFFYKDFVFDARVHACRDPESVQEMHENIADRDRIVRGYQGEGEDFLSGIVEVKRATGKKMRTPDEKILLKDWDKAFSYLWRETPEHNRWDAVIHQNKTPYQKHEAHGPDANSKEVSPYKGDFLRWIHLQAHKAAEFATDQEGLTVPIYHIALDSQDHTSYSDSHGSVKGHISPLQVSAVLVFMEKMLAQNPRARFKLAMHYPPEDLVWRSRRALKRLLNRDEVIMLVTAHTHQRGYTADLRSTFSLKRESPLPHLLIPSTADETREVVVEEMAFRQEAGGGTIDFKFDFVGLSEQQIADPERDKEVYQAVAELEEDLIRRKEGLIADIEGAGYPRKIKLRGEMGPEYTYLNEDEVIATLDDPLMKIVANGKSNRRMQAWTAVKMYVGMGKALKNNFTAQVSVPQMKQDFETLLVYLDILAALYETDCRELGLDSRAVEFNRRRRDLKLIYFQVWLPKYERMLSQKFGDSELATMADLYTLTQTHDLFAFINKQMPPTSRAQKFAKIVAMRAAQEEARYHGYPDAKQTGVPDQIRFSVRV